MVDHPVENNTSLLHLFTIFARAQGFIKDSEVVPYDAIVLVSIILFREEHHFGEVKTEKWSTAWELMRPTPVHLNKSGYLEVMNEDEVRSATTTPKVTWAPLDTRFRAILYLFGKGDEVPSPEQVEGCLESDSGLAHELTHADGILRKAWITWFDHKNQRKPGYTDAVRKGNKILAECVREIRDLRRQLKRLVQKRENFRAASDAELKKLNPNHGVTRKNPRMS